MVLDPQGGATSSTLPMQVSVAVPLAPSVVTGLPPWVQTCDVVVPPGNGTVFVTERLMTVLSGFRFWTLNVHVIAAPGDANVGHVFEIANPVVTWIPLVRGAFMSVRTVRVCPVPSVAIREHGVTRLAAPKAPVKSVPPSPRAPPVTKASRPVASPTESMPRPAPPSSALLRRFAPWLDGPPSTGLIPSAL